LWIRHPELTGSRRATPTSYFNKLWDIPDATLHIALPAVQTQKAVGYIECTLYVGLMNEREKLSGNDVR
jgi:hypothetical protein